ncbi:hypothetical protein GOODEAATRI_012256 [Goodea atripinnis]|uniref:Uncharacterized protein n=1 Tax=Goodea atripinnis TaxID=208336 RepID=A0ABV0N0R4_9TELE
MRRVEAEVDEEGDRHSKLKPLHHIGGLLAIQGRGHVTPQDHALSSACRHKPGLLSYSVGTWQNTQGAFITAVLNSMFHHPRSHQAGFISAVRASVTADPHTEKITSGIRRHADETTA